MAEVAESRRSASPEDSFDICERHEERMIWQNSHTLAEQFAAT
jgi:hypothetical protein